MGVVEISEPGPSAGATPSRWRQSWPGLTGRSLRPYERHGLLEPARPTGGTRRFSQDDLRRFRRISELVGDGVNLTGICKILDLEQDTRELRTDHRTARRQRQVAGRPRPARGRTPSRRSPPTGTATSPPDQADPPARAARTMSPPSWTSERTRAFHSSCCRHLQSTGEIVADILVSVTYLLVRVRTRTAVRLSRGASLPATHGRDLPGTKQRTSSHYPAHPSRPAAGT
jgi:DNA-binding transcriptional MerR regulator